ncbi:MAG: Eco57I restriction-modification methylase domain-containing protein [Candidatus Hodarchaeota archaeon]
MATKSNWPPSYQILVPLSIIPALTYIDQFYIISSKLNSIFNNLDVAQWNLFLSTKARLEKKKTYVSLNHVKLSNESEKYWKFYNFVFLFLKYDIKELFTKERAELLQLIRNELDSNSIKWFFVNSSNGTLIFSLTSNHYLLWSPIIPGLEYIFQTLIILFPKLLDSLTDSYRWKKLENGKKNISNIMKLWFEDLEVRELHHIKSSQFHVSMLIQILEETQKEILFELKRNVQKAVNSIDEINIKNALDYILDPNLLFLFKDSQINDYQDFFRNNNDDLIKKSFFQALVRVNIERILDIYPINFLEIFPQFISNSNYQETGSYYTPIALAEVLVKQSFEELIQNTNDRNKKYFDVYDPAMGTGIILLYSLEWLINHNLKSNDRFRVSFEQLRQKIFNKCVFGCDIDEKAIKTASEYMKFFCGGDTNEKNLLLNLKTDNLFEFFLNQNLDMIVPKKYDVIITNPPYLALHSRFIKYPLTSCNLKSLRKILPKFSGNRDNLYLLFLGICLEHLSKQDYGVVGFVLDRSFLDLPSYKEIRNNVLLNYHLSYILGEYHYKGAVVDLALIVFNHFQDPTKKVMWQKSISSNKIEITKNHFSSTLHCAFIYQKNGHLIDHIQETSIPLGEICKISCGVEYGSLLKTHFLSDKPNQGFFPVIDGSNGLPHPYILFWVSNCPNSYVRFDKAYEKELVMKKRNISKSNKKVLLISGNLKRFFTPKIFIRQTAPQFIATYDKNNHLGLRNLHIIYEVRPPYSLFLILGILNSFVGSFIGENLNIIRKGGPNRYPQIRLNDLKSFPIRSLENSSTKKLHWKEEIENNVEECINIGNNISSVLVDIWENVHSNFKSQRYFLQSVLNNKISRYIPSVRMKKISSELKNLGKLLDKLEKHQKLIDHFVKKLYNIEKELPTD